jgi:predicted dehydrogenase
MPGDLMVDLATQRRGAVVNDYFHAQLRYPTRHPGLRVLLHGSALVPAVGPRFLVHGTLGSWVKYGLDVQEDALKAGGRPQWEHSQIWGIDPRPATTTVHTDGAPRSLPPVELAGNYMAFYAQLRDFLQGQAAAPAVAPGQVLQDMQLLVLGEQSAREGRFMPVAVAG